MINKYLLILFFSSKILYSLDKRIEQKFDKLEHINNAVQIVEASVKVIVMATHAAQFAKSYLCPAQEERYQTEVINRKLRILRTEEELAQCLIIHARTPREDNQLPFPCKSMVDSYAAIAGFARLNAIEAEFLKAANELSIGEADSFSNKAKVSTKKKVIIGAVIAGGVGLAIVAVPIIFPGTLVASKATAITASVKSFVSTVGTKIASHKIVGNGLAIISSAKDAAIHIVDGTIEIVSTMPAVDQIKLATAIVVNIENSNRHLELVREYIYRASEDELRNLKVPLSERIKLAHQEK